MQKPNLVCKICGKPYYLCAKGAKAFPYLQIVCSAECYDKWLEAVNPPVATPAPKRAKKVLVEEPEKISIEE